MGLSSSQARLLNLTSRMHQIEYKAAKLEAMKLQMANESKRVYEDYLDALEKTKIQVKTLQTDGSVTYVDVNDYASFVNAGFAIVVHNVPYSQTIPADSTNPLADAPTTTPSPAPKTKSVVCTTAEQLKAAIGAIYKNESGTALDISTALTSNFETLLTNLINSGDVTLLQKNKDGKFQHPDSIKFADFETSVSTNTGLQEVTDEVNLKKAEAKYEADMKRIDMKDRKYDSDLAAMDAERNAVKQEMETLKTVANDNVERTFKLFS